MEESILLSSDSNPSSPLLLPPDLDLDLGIPKAKMSDICGSKHSGLESNVISSKPSTSSWSSFEPIPSTSKCIPPLMIPNDGLKDSVSDDNDSFTWRSASLNFESRLSKSGMSSKTDVTDLNTHQPSDSDAGLSDFLSDSEKEPLVKKDENCQTNTLNLNDADECPKWVSVMDEDTDPPSSRSSSTIPPDQAPFALISSVSECSTIPPHRPPSLHSSDSASTLPPEAAHPTRCRNFEKRPSFHDISDSDSTGTVEAVPSTFPDEAVSKDFKYTPHDISLSEDESENPSCSSLSTLPPLLDDKSARLFATQSEPIFPDAHNISEFVSQLVNSPLLTTASSQPLPSQKGSRSRVNAVDVLERKRLKELKIKEKQERAAESERLRRMKPGECMKYITVELDQSIVSEYPWAPAVVEILQTAGIKCRVDTSSDPCTVKWTREQADSIVLQQEKHILFLWSTEKLLTSVQYGTLSDSFAELKKKYTHFKMYFCVYGLHSYYRKFHKAKQRQNNTSAPPQRKRKSNYDIIPDQLEMELIALQIKYGISHKILNSPQDTAFFLQTITKSVAEMPFKMEKEKVEMERNWYAKGDSKKCVRIDKDFNGLRQLWLQHLSQFNLSSLDIAKSIAELYPTPLILYHAYRQCLSTKEKETMLQDIVVKRGPGGGGRRLGPELSRKISIMFCQEEDVPLD